MTRLGPGWLCHPKVPPGAMMFSRMWTSVAPFAEMLTFQKSVAAPGSTSVFALASIPPWNRPMTGDHGGLVTPEGGVATGGPAVEGGAREPQNSRHDQFPSHCSVPFDVRASTTRIGSSPAPCAASAEWCADGASKT